MDGVQGFNHSSAAPSDGIWGLKQNWKFDLLAGFSVFLIALPLSIGISVASGAPPTAGLIAAIVGGILGSLLGGSFLTINGPAAGLISVVIVSVQLLGAGDLASGFRRTLAAIVFAGLLQCLLAIARAATLALMFPSSVIHGMLAAIGVIIIAKQGHVLLGVAPHAKSVFGSLAEIPHSFLNLNPEVAFIGISGLLFLFVLSRAKHPLLRRCPPALVVAVTGTLLGLLFDLDHQHTVKFFKWSFAVGPSFLLNIPTHVKDAIIFPDFSLIAQPLFWQMVITIFFVSSIESILSAVAVEKQDPYRRPTELNRELLSKGICNVASSSIGGLPMIAEIVRSTANVGYGAKTRWSNFFHGVFILAFLILLPGLLHEIPLAALAAILCSVGYRLASPNHFVHAYEKGLDHFLTFLTTFGDIGHRSFGWRGSGSRVGAVGCLFGMVSAQWKFSGFRRRVVFWKGWLNFAFTRPSRSLIFCACDDG